MEHKASKLRALAMNVLLSAIIASFICVVVYFVDTLTWTIIRNVFIGWIFIGVIFTLIRKKTE